MEKYFEVLRIEEGTSKINTATLYLTEDAILWWRRCKKDIKRGSCFISKWDEFKVELKKQFRLENVEEVAMMKLQGLKQIVSI